MIKFRSLQGSASKHGKVMEEFLMSGELNKKLELKGESEQKKIEIQPLNKQDLALNNLMSFTIKYPFQ